MPPQFSVRIDDHGVYAGLKKLATTLKPMSQAETDSVIENAKSEVSGYYKGGASYNVPTRPNQTYIRTGNFGRSVFWERIGLTYRVIVSAYNKRGQEYGPYVVGRADGSGQAGIHAGRWPNFREVMLKWADVAVARVQAAVERAIIDFGL